MATQVIVAILVANEGVMNSEVVVGVRMLDGCGT
jgi:hypothetical protein